MYRPSVEEVVAQTPEEFSIVQHTSNAAGGLQGNVDVYSEQMGVM